MSTTLKRLIKILSISCIGYVTRLVAIKNANGLVSPRVEISTPINSWKRATEAVFLFDSGLNPYEGNIFHESPLSLQFYKFISTYFITEHVFAFSDVMTALLLMLSCQRQPSSSSQDKPETLSTAMRVLLIYLFSPITLLPAAGLSTAIFTNLLIALILFTLQFKVLKTLTCLLCALLTCNNIHYCSLILPVFLCIEYYSDRKDSIRRESKQDLYYKRRTFQTSLFSSIALYFTFLILLMTASYLLMGSSWTFLRSVYLFTLKVGDLTPNIGMFWYFFTEMFDHFLSFFTWVVQINAFIHIIPVTIYLKDRPLFLFYMLLLISTIFQPYPSLSSIGLVFSLLPRYSEQTAHMKHKLIIVCSMVTCMSLWPIFWHLWIVVGTANSNFYFGATLAFTSSLIILTTDILNSHVLASAKLKLEEYKRQLQRSSEKESMACK